METTNDKIALEIYTKMYKESTPKANLVKLMKSGETQKPDWFMKYYLAQERQIEIIDEILAKHKIKKEYLISKWHTEILLGAAPRGVK